MADHFQIYRHTGEKGRNNISSFFVFFFHWRRNFNNPCRNPFVSAPRFNSFGRFEKGRFFADFYNNEQALGLEEVHGETHHTSFDESTLSFIICQVVFSRKTIYVFSLKFRIGLRVACCSSFNNNRWRNKC